MAKKDLEVTQKKDIAVNEDGKTPGIEVNKDTTVAPIDKPTEEVKDEMPAAEDIADVVAILNILDKEVGGKGEITEIPDTLRSSLGFLVKSLSTVKDMWEDPTWEDILDDLRDQKEDGMTPSIEVAVARTIPLDKLQALVESEDYEGVQTELRGSLDASKSAADEETMYNESFDKMQAEAQTYADEMGYDEERKNELLNAIFNILKIVGDGKLSKVEFAEFDKMINYGPDTTSLRDQLSSQDAKEVLPDKSSVDAALSPAMPKKTEVKNEPGLDSLAYYEEPDYTQTGRRRFNKK